MENSEGMTNAPSLCASGCGFFGNRLTLNMCSKCYKDHIAMEKLEAETLKKISPPMPVEQPVQPSTPPMASSPSSDPFLPASASPALSSSPVASERPTQVDKSRCWECKKRFGMVGYPCQCGYTFCSGHRYTDQHKCTYNFKDAERARLVDNNKAVIASKIQHF